MAGDDRALGGNGHTIESWLGLDDVDNEVIEYMTMLAHEIRRRRTEAGLSQAEFGQKIGRSQATVAKAEYGQISIKGMLGILFATGSKAADLMVGGGPARS